MTTVQHMNEIIECVDLVKIYEDIGYFEDEETVLMISDNKFTRRCKITGEVGSLEYPNIGKYDCENDFSEEQLMCFALCVSLATSLGFYVD